MKRRSPKTRQAIKRSYLWHRRLGVLVAVPLLVICVTGILLNHTRDFKLEEKTLNSALLLEWYAMTPSQPPRGLGLGQDFISFFEGALYLNEKRILPSSRLIAAAPQGEVIVVSTQDALILIDGKAHELIDILGAEFLPEGKIRAARIDEKHVLLDMDSGVYSVDADFESVQLQPSTSLERQALRPAPESIEAGILRQWRGEGVSLSKLVLDLHSGAFFGSFGRFMSDLVAVVLILLVFTGLFNTLMIQRKK